MRPQSFSLSLSLTNAQGSTELCKQVNHDPPRGEQIDFWRRFKGIHYKDSWAGLKELLLSGEETLGASSLRNESRRRKQPRVTPITTETSSHTVDCPAPQPWLDLHGSDLGLFDALATP